MNSTDDLVLVTIGYDRRLDYLHCVVQASEDETLYSNLDDEKAGTTLQDVRYYEEVLESLGIKLPEAIFKEVESDQLLRVGNRLVVYNQDGSIAKEITREITSRREGIVIEDEWWRLVGDKALSQLWKAKAGSTEQS
jgi:hypothetical protein